MDTLGAAPGLVAEVPARLRGTGLWHEAYFMRGGIDAMYDDMGAGSGLPRFAPVVDSRGPMFSTRGRVYGEAAKAAPVVAESAYYRGESE
ncbi:hypothetical protein [Nocardia sp. NPDC049707]|uniref:hypothetical protein n=1 Tax=Nocardia sp. NPDC049707 TaxID=3154735 RepID=UPI00341E42F1